MINKIVKIITQKINVMNKIICFLLTICFFGCNSMLDLTDPTSFSPQQYYKTQEEMDAAVVGAYGRLRSAFGTFWWAGDCRADNGSFYTANADRNAIQLIIPLAENFGNVKGEWENQYSAILGANAVLENVENATYTNPSLKQQHIGEAKMIRALAYFNLAMDFGGYTRDGELLGVPLITSRITAAESLKLPRASLEDTYTLIVQDISDAISALPPTATGVNKGRFVSASAQALLGKVYMFMAGYPLEKGQSYYAKAATEFAAIVGNASFKLVPSYAQLFNEANKNSSEALIEVQYQSNRSLGTGNSWQSLMMTDRAAAAIVPAGGAGSGQNMPTRSLIRAFAAGDPRKSVTMRPGYIEASGLYNEEPYPRKYWQPFGAAISNVDHIYNWGSNYKVLRLAEVYLLYAEALVKSGGDKNVAITYLNKVRERARTTNTSEDPTIAVIEAAFPNWNPGDPAVSLKDYVTGDFANDDALLLAIENEARVELASEGHRWWYLIRTKRAPDVVVPALLENSGVTITWDDRDYAFPIPQEAMQMAPGALIQNKGYAQF